MRKFFCALLMLVIFSSCSFAEVNPDQAVHSVIGGLYSLAAAACLNDNVKPHVNNLAAYFKDIPDNWQNDAKIERINSSIWVGVNVGKYSGARHFLRDNAEALDIKESPEGLAWIGGNDAWIKAFDIKDEKIKSSLRLKAAKGSGKDSNIIFLSTEGQNSWWQMSPTPKAATADKIISRWGIKNAPELHKPESSNRVSIYESVKPSDVRKKPANIHIGTRKNNLDMSMNIGDVVFTPVPQLKRDKTTIEEIDDDEKQISSENVNYDKTGSEQDENK
ncbi:MAG: hypothetical protein IJG34_03750 [Synergistaceae bacterium]|nr:hypothetical protein [Synergistaceae bacterium]MBQ3448992.1 hypothetical protein [Synergistaceae bacterium]MBR0249662.1 hypothetical protein [Synergistaceae bacterium]